MWLTFQHVAKSGGVFFSVSYENSWQKEVKEKEKEIAWQKFKADDLVERPKKVYTFIINPFTADAVKALHFAVLV